MTITIKKNKKLELPVTEFTCDGSINDNLDKYDMLKTLNGFKFTIICGKPGSGKTSLMTSWMVTKGKKKIFRKVFDNVVVVMPTTSRNSMKKNIFKNHHADKMFDELDYPTVNKITNMLHESADNKETTLLILDDIGASLKNNDIQKLLRKIIYNRRHLKTHIIMLIQSFISCPKEIRKLVNNVVMVGRPSKVESQTLFDELFENDKDDAVHMMKEAFVDPHDYLFLNVDSQRYFKDFDELILNSKNNLAYTNAKEE